MAEVETINPDVHKTVTITMSVVEAQALAAAAEVGVEGMAENVGQDEADRAWAGMEKVRKALEGGSAAPTYTAFNAQGHAVQVTIPENER